MFNFFYLLHVVLSADNICEQFGPRAGLTQCQTWSGSKLFDTLMVFLKIFFEKIDFFKKISRRQKSMKYYPVGKESKIWLRIGCILGKGMKYYINSKSPFGCDVSHLVSCWFWSWWSLEEFQNSCHVGIWLLEQNNICNFQSPCYPDASHHCSILLDFVWFDSLRPINNLSVKQGRVSLGWPSTKLG